MEDCVYPAQPSESSVRAVTLHAEPMLQSTTCKSDSSDSGSSSEEWDNESDDMYFYPSENESFYSNTTVEAMCISKPVVTLAARWDRLLQTKEWSDCKFVIMANQECAQQEFECHRLVLASCSPVFGAMLLGGMAETSTVIKIQDETPDTFSLLLEFAYTGKVRKCKFSEAMHLYVAADKYQIEGLIEICEDMMCEELCPGNLCEAFQMSEQYSLNKLKDFNIRMLQDHTKEVISSTTFQNFSLDLLLLLVCQDQLSVDSEQQLADAIMQWATVQLEEELRNGETTDGSPEEEEEETKEVCGDIYTEESTATQNQESSKCESNEVLSQNKLKVTTKTKAAIKMSQKLRTLLGYAFKHIRFLAPSFEFDSFIEKYPGILTNEEIFGIKSFRDKYKQLENKESQETLVGLYEFGHLSQTLHNEHKERILPVLSKYKNKCGKRVKLKHGPLIMCDRDYKRDIEYEMNGESGDYFDCAFYLIPDRDITLHGIRVPSQVDLSGVYPPNSTYVENIVVEVTKLGDSTRTNSRGEKILYEKNHGGRIQFHETVPYNSTINIMFPVPFRMFDAYSFEIKVEFNVAGTYPVVQNGENTPHIGGVTLHFKQIDSIGKMCLIQGVIFESRDKNPPRMSKWNLLQLYEITSRSEHTFFSDPFYDDGSDSDEDSDW